MWTRRHSENKKTVQTHDDFYSRKKQGSGDNKSYALIFDEAFSVFLDLCPLWGPGEASESCLGCGSGAYLKVCMSSLCGSSSPLPSAGRSKRF